MQGKVCLVTGANRGIGRAVADTLAAQGASVLMVCRDRAAGERAQAEMRAAHPGAAIELFVADFMVQAEVRRVAGEIAAAHPRLDVLINNAGAFFMHRTMTVDNVEATFAVNHLAPFILTTSLLDTLKASAPARVVNVSSEAHQRVSDPEDWESRNGYGGISAYARSKLADVMFTYDLADRLAGTGVTANCCHPGLVNTQLLAQEFDRWWLRWAWPLARRRAVAPEEGARTIVYLATSDDVEGVTGKYFKDCRPASSSLISHDAVISARLWNISLRLSGELPPVTITGEIIAS